MAKLQSNVRIYGDDEDAVYVGEKGSVAPVGLAAPGAAFLEIGWLGEDGIGFDQDKTVNTFPAHQGGTIVRRKASGVDRSFTFQALEESAVVLGLYYPGLAATTAGGVTTFKVPGGARTDERSWIVDTHDGDIHKRAYIPVGEVGETGTISHTNSGLTIYEFTVGINGDFDLVSNNPAWATA